MNRRFYRNILRSALVLFAGLLAGCEADDRPGGEEAVPVTIRLALPDDGLATRAVDEEAINTLDVYIVNDNNGVDARLTKTDFNADMEATVDLYPGTKHIYAVANAGNPYENTAPANVAVNAFTWLTDEATAVPMSTTADTTWTVINSQTHEVRLNRMVAKMNVKVIDERTGQAETISSVTISDLMAKTTNLYRKGYGVISLPTDVTASEWEWENLTFENTEAKSGDFYLHENSGTFPLSVKVGNDTREGSFTATIPRNHIFPLVIHITDYSLEVKVTYQLAAIGTAPVTKKQSGYSFKLPEGCTFKVEVTPKKNTGAWADRAFWTWTAPTLGDNSAVKLADPIAWPINKLIGTDDPFTFTGQIASVYEAGDGFTIPISLTDGEATLNFQLQMEVRALGNDEMKTKASVSAETAVHIDL